MKHSALAVFFLSLLSVAFADIRYLELPAVSEEGIGTLVNISVASSAGNGSIYVSTSPLAGETFQRSINEVFDYIRSTDNITNYDFYINSDASAVAYLLDGPSAGAALGIMAKSLANNDLLRHDITITGGLDSIGNLIPVGALGEKAEVSSLNGKKAILVQPDSMDDRIELDRISNELGMAVVEYRSFDEAYNIFSGNGSLSNNLSYKKQAGLPDISMLEKAEPHAEFSLIVDGFIADLNAEAELIRRDFPAAYEYIDAKRELAIRLKELGYSYSAGNEAFLALYRLRTLSSPISDGELIYLRKRVENCLERTARNLNGSLDAEHYMNAELRYFWAERELEQSAEDDFMDVSRRVEELMSLERAGGWCTLAENLSQNANAGRKVDAAMLGAYAKNTADFYISENQSSRYLIDSLDAYSRGYYGASLMELIFHESIANETYDQLLDDYSPKSNWSRMMYFHSDYLDSSGDYGAGSGMQIRRLAYFFDLYLGRLEANETASEPIQLQPQPAEPGQKSEFILLILISILISVILLLISIKKK